MSLEACPGCGKRISTAAESCPKCGQPLPAGWVEAQRKKQGSRMATGCLVVILLIGGLWLLAQLGDHTDDKCGDALGAYLMSERFMKRRLKAPSTASFAGHHNSTTTRLDCALWRVSSYVDAQNGFGAMVRTRYTAVLSFDGQKAWTLKSLDTQ